MRRAWSLLGVLVAFAGIAASGRVVPPAASQAGTPTAGLGAACPTTTPAENKALVRGYWEAISNGGAAEQVGVTVADLLAEGDEVVARLSWSGPKSVAIEPPATPAAADPVAFDAIAIYRVACGRMAEQWLAVDSPTMLRRLGIVTDDDLAAAGTPSVANRGATATNVATATVLPRRPSVFIGSSREGVRIAEILELNLELVADVTLWTHGAFDLTEGNLENLVEAGERFDFAVLVLTPDDVTTKRGQTLPSPRDNVIFELGYFMGLLGRERTFMVYNRDEPMHMPTDLAGVSAATFGTRGDGNLEAALGPATTRITLAMAEVLAAED